MNPMQDWQQATYIEVVMHACRISTPSKAAAAADATYVAVAELNKMHALKS